MKYEVGQTLYCGSRSQNVGSPAVNKLKITRVGRIYLYAGQDMIRIRGLCLEEPSWDVQCYLTLEELTEANRLQADWKEFQKFVTYTRKPPAVLTTGELGNLQKWLFRDPPGNMKGRTMYFVITVDNDEGYLYFDHVPAKDENEAVALVKKFRPYAKSSDAYDALWLAQHLHQLRTITPVAAMADLRQQVSG